MKPGRKIFPAFVTLMIALVSSCAAPAPTHNFEDLLPQLTPFAAQERYIIAVLPFEFKGGKSEYQDVGNRLVDIAIVELFNTRRFRLVERSRIDAVIEEIQLGQMGVTESAMADRIGKQVGAEMVMAGAITSIRPIMAKDTVGLAWRETRGFEVSLQGRLVNIAKGEIIAVGQATGSEAQTMKVAMGAQTGSIAPDQALLDKAIEKAVKALVNDFAGNVIPKSS